jgi:hypothetical protein
MLHRFLIPACSLLVAASAVATEPLTASASVAPTATTPAPAATPAPEPKAANAKDTGAKELSGMSILGNQEAPKALVIVPWKSSQLGDTLGIAKNLDDGRQPVDKEVFMRQLSYYEIRTGAK